MYILPYALDQNIRWLTNILGEYIFLNTVHIFQLELFNFSSLMLIEAFCQPCLYHWKVLWRVQKNRWQSSLIIISLLFIDHLLCCRYFTHFLTLLTTLSDIDIILVGQLRKLRPREIVQPSKDQHNRKLWVIIYPTPYFSTMLWYYFFLSPRLQSALDVVKGENIIGKKQKMKQ